MKKGFTIVELLIVIVIIGILSAITIVTYTSIQNSANDTAVRSDLANIVRTMEIYNAQNGRYLPSIVNSATEGDGRYRIVLTQRAYETTSVSFNALYCSSSPYDNYALLATSKSGKRFYVSSTSGVQEYTGAANAWTGSDAQAICRTVLAGSTNSGLVGFSRGANPQWRPWTTGN